MPQRNGFALIVSLMVLVLLVMLGAFMVQFLTVSWQDEVLSTMRINKVYAEKSAWAWAEGYFQLHQTCFPEQTLHFGFDFEMHCEQQGEQFNLRILSVTDNSGTKMAPLVQEKQMLLP